MTSVTKLRALPVGLFDQSVGGQKWAPRSIPPRGSSRYPPVPFLDQESDKTGGFGPLRPDFGLRATPHDIADVKLSNRLHPIGGCRSIASSTDPICMSRRASGTTSEEVWT
ncbi:hypothetical protein [Nocardia sp. NPDC050718]|uniref:hypothetical protein n=1 Tax=Nocardia sp. NPDC050718 TaxID=3155788 RepID=UPI00340F16F2